MEYRKILIALLFLSVPIYAWAEKANPLADFTASETNISLNSTSIQNTINMVTNHINTNYDTAQINVQTPTYTSPAYPSQYQPPVATGVFDSQEYVYQNSFNGISYDDIHNSLDMNEFMENLSDVGLYEDHSAEEEEDHDESTEIASFSDYVVEVGPQE